MITIPFIVCIAGFIFWLVLSHPSEKPHWAKVVLSKAAEWCFVIGLFWTLYPYVGKVAF